MAIEATVKFENRPITDLACTVFFALMLLVNLGSSFFMLAKKNVYIDSEVEGNSTYVTVTRSDSLIQAEADCQKEHSAGRRLDSLGSKADIWTVLQEFPQIPAVMIIFVLALGVSWLFLLQKFSKPVVWATCFVKVAVWVMLGVWLIKLDSKETGGLCLAGAGLWAVVMFLTRDKINKAAEHLEIACTALREEPGIFAATAIIKTVYLAYLTLYCVVVINSAFIWEVNYEKNLVCDPFPVQWAGKMVTFQTACMVWVTYFTKAAKCNVTAMSVASWYFDQRPRPSNPAIAGLKATFTTSVGTLALGSLICTIVERLLAQARSKFWWTNPMGCILKCLILMLQTLIETLTKFTLIVHALTGLAFFPAAGVTFDTLKRHFVGAMVTDQVGTNVLRLGAYVFSIAVGFASWAWVDDVKGWHTLDLSGWEYEALFYVFLVLYLYLTYYPLPTIFLCAIVSQYIQGEFSAPIVAIFMSAIAHICLGYIADIVLDAMDTVFLCYAISKDNNLKVEGREQMYILLAEMPSCLNEDETKAIAGGVYAPSPATQTQLVQVQVPQGMGPGQTFQAQTAGGLVSVTVPNGCGPGSMLSISVPSTMPVANAYAV